MHPRIRNVIRAVKHYSHLAAIQARRIAKRLRDYAGIHQALLLLTFFILFNNIISI